MKRISLLIFLLFSLLSFGQHLEIESLNQRLKSFTEFDNYSVDDTMKTYYLVGDYFGDSIMDIVILFKDKVSKTTKIAFINYRNTTTKTYILGLEDGDLGLKNFSWAEIFENVAPKEILWSNYEDDWIAFEDVPENKKVQVNYNALYLHAAESCGGGFIFWKDGKFNWLQQE